MRKMLSILAALLMTATLSFSQGIFLKIDGIKGESKDKAHAGWIDISSFEQSVSREESGREVNRRARSNANFDPISMVKNLDFSSPKIAEAVARGKVFPKVQIHFAQYAGIQRAEPYLTYTLMNVRITKYSISGKEGRPTEEFSLSFDRIEVIYNQLDKNGKKKGTAQYKYDIQKGQ